LVLYFQLKSLLSTSKKSALPLSRANPHGQAAILLIIKQHQPTMALLQTNVFNQLPTAFFFGCFFASAFLTGFLVFFLLGIFSPFHFGFMGLFLQ
jgi:hypothetical protein